MTANEPARCCRSSPRSAGEVSRLHAIATVFRSALKNSALRRTSFAYLLSRASDSGVWIAFLVYAFRHGGATSSVLMVLVQIVPCVVFFPFFGALADYVRPSRMLKFNYTAQTVAITGVAVAVGLGASVAVVFLLASLTSLAMSTARPSHAALLPGIVRTPEELTAANVMGGWADGAANLVGPGLAGILYAVVEGLARRLVLEFAPRGSNVITEGDHGDCYYCVADGTLSVTRRGRLVQSLQRGDGFGELALLRDIPRQATVTADSDAVLYRLDKRSFLEMISSSPTASSMAEAAIFSYGDDGD